MNDYETIGDFFNEMQRKYDVKPQETFEVYNACCDYFAIQNINDGSMNLVDMTVHQPELFKMTERYITTNYEGNIYDPKGLC